MFAHTLKHDWSAMGADISQNGDSHEFNRMIISLYLELFEIIILNYKLDITINRKTNICSV